jgi:hypothetical protein
MPFVANHSDARKDCSSLVHNMELKSTKAGDTTASSIPRKKRTAKNPAKLNTAA